MEIEHHLYEVKPLDDIEACELLSNHAFTTPKKLEIRTDLVDRVLNYAGGLPLALVVLGSFLLGRREDEWEITLEKLSWIPNYEINEVLKISYDGLHENEKEIFLHIACFFNQWSSEYVKKVLNNCDFEAAIGLQILIERSLIKIDEYGLLKVTGLIQLMGMDIVRQECRDDPGRRSRLWLYDDVVDILSRDMGDCAVTAIVLEPPKLTEIYLKEFKLPSFPLESLQTSVATIEHVIGIDDRVKDVIKLLDIEDYEVGVRIVGIHGTNGIGKTTIAKAVYDQLSSCFDSCSFLAEVGEKAENVGGIQFVQTKLICDILEQDGDVASFEGGIKFFLDVFRNIKVLIVLDDVEDQSHLNDLVGDQLDWFGPGSRIIVTSENGEILQEYVSRRLARIYEVNEMDNDRAFELFCNHALGIHGSIFDHLETAKRIIEAMGQVPPVMEVIGSYLETAKRIIEATGQVPFVIEVIGPLLRGKPIEDWLKIEDLIKPQKEKSQERLKDCRETLKICYEALHEKQKQIFWDIAWFANGVDSRIASYMWPDQDLLPSHHVLMPLAKIGGDNVLWMHKLLKRLSRTMDKEEPKYPGRRSRQYMHVTDLEVINKKEGMEEVEALSFDFKNLHLHSFTETDFKSMPSIRFLKLDHAKMTGNFENVFPNLRWLRWQGCPRDFVAAEFSLTELVILDLSWSKVTEDWGGWRLIKMEQLKVLNLSGCTDLLISPTFFTFPNLEILILERCSRLVHLDPSVGGLKKLLCLNLKSCTELNRLPAELGALKALKELLIDETSMRDIPFGGDSKELETLSASNCLSLSLPDGVGELVKLRCLSLSNCHLIRKLPGSIGQSPLEKLDISGTGISEMPDSFGNLQRLRVLKMDYCFISKFPSFIWRLHSIEEIHASSCRNLNGEIPGDIGKLKNLRILRLRNSTITRLPPEIVHLPKLEILDVLHCDMLQELPALPSSLVIVHLSPKLKEKVSDLLMEHCFITV
ncbi:disease resistance protein RRS1-like [Syzygium oleosum]|uniref:disease resistance protein RRS1-like n=1 Tax=Syzygium oleosum TaxID=219896 RepID=UPI0024B93237|nr:disease resistance protein RRS1-like [Syzygium oleosum]